MLWNSNLERRFSSKKIIVLTSFLYTHVFFACPAPCCYTSGNFRNRLLAVSVKTCIYTKTDIFSHKHIWTIREPLSEKSLYFFFYGRLLCLRCAGWGLLLVLLSWAHPEVRQTPGGPRRPAWPLRPGRPVWPLSPGCPGCPSKALPGRPGWPVIQ